MPYLQYHIFENQPLSFHNRCIIPFYHSNCLHLFRRAPIFSDTGTDCLLRGEAPGQGRVRRVCVLCKFLRAWYYYCLNCRWRGVPVYLENLAPEEYTKPRLTENQVWEQIIDDCSDCIECESLPEKYSSTDADYGRITKGAAYTLRGKVYMWQKEWKKAVGTAHPLSERGPSGKAKGRWPEH